MTPTNILKNVPNVEYVFNFFILFLFIIESNFVKYVSTNVRYQDIMFYTTYYKYHCGQYHIVYSWSLCHFRKRVGARGQTPLWSPPWVLVTFGHCFIFFLIFYSLFFTALDALPFPALPCPALPLPLPLPCFKFSFCCQGQQEEVTSSSPVGGSAPLDSVIVGGGVRFDGSLVAGMDETSVRLDGWRFERVESGVASFTSPKAFIYRW